MNGLSLPPALERIVRGGRGEWTRWMMKEPVIEKGVNAYFDEFDCGDLEIFNLDTMIEETAELPGRFDPVSDED